MCVNSEAEREKERENTCMLDKGRRTKAVVHVLYYTIKVHYTQKFNITYTLSMSEHVHVHVHVHVDM